MFRDAARATTIHLKGPRQKFNVQNLTLHLEVKCLSQNSKGIFCSSCYVNYVHFNVSYDSFNIISNVSNVHN